MHVAMVLPLSDPVPNQGTEPTPYSVHCAPASGRGSCPVLDAILLSKGPRQGGERIAEDRSTTGSERRDTGNFLTNIDGWEVRGDASRW
jgi:hypothetical protein